MKRDVYVDFLKGISILAVIVGHSVSHVERLSLLFNIIYSFHMPLLFFLSGYLEEAVILDKRRNILVKRMKSLLIPYLCWTILLYAVDLQMPFYINTNQFLSNLFGYTQNGLWFLPVLFGLKCMHCCLWKIQNKNKDNLLIKTIINLVIIELIIISLAVITRLPYVINMVSYAIPYFFGVILQCNAQCRRLIRHEGIITSSIIAYFAGMHWFSFHNTDWTTQVLRIGLSLCVIVVLYNCRGIFEKAQNNGLNRAICYFGRNSMGIYLLHGRFNDYVAIYSIIESSLVSGIFSVFMAVITAFLCTVIMKILSVSSCISSLLFGSVPKKEKVSV